MSELSYVQNDCMGINKEHCKKNLNQIKGRELT